MIDRLELVVVGLLVVLLVVSAIVVVVALGGDDRECVRSHLQPIPVVVGKTTTIQLIPICDEYAPRSRS